MWSGSSGLTVQIARHRPSFQCPLPCAMEVSRPSCTAKVHTAKVSSPTSMSVGKPLTAGPLFRGGCGRCSRGGKIPLPGGLEFLPPIALGDHVTDALVLVRLGHSVVVQRPGQPFP